MALKLKSSEWRDFSERIVRIYGLPKGSELRLYRKRDGRRVRSDMVIKRRAVNRSNVKQLKGADTVAHLLRRACTLLSTDIEARGLEVRLYGPDGGRVYGNTHIRTFRESWPAGGEWDSESADVFLNILETSGLGDASLQQAFALYNQLRKVIGEEFFENQLLRHKSGLA